MRTSGYTTILQLASGFVAAGALACAAAVTPGSGSGDAASDGADDAALDGSTATGPTVIPTTPIPVPTQGGVFLANFTAPNQHGYAYAFAEFYPRPEAGGISCRQTAGDGCTVSFCDESSDAGTALSLLSAGDIEVTAPDGYSFLLDDSNSALSAYPGQDLPVPWPAGNTVLIRALGGQVDPFSAQLQFPSGADVSAVSGHATGEAMMLDRGAPLVVSWTPVDGNVELALHPSYDAYTGTPTAYACPMLCPTNVSVRCRFDGHAGSGRMTAATLSSVPMGVPMFLDTYGIAERAVVVGGLTVTIDLVNRSSETQQIQFH